MRRIPERVFHARGAAAKGYFEVTHDISELTSAKVFNGVGKKTPVAVRFSTATNEKGSPESESFHWNCKAEVFHFNS